MSIKRKIILSVSVMMIMIMAIAVGIGLFNGKPDTSTPSAPSTPTIKVNQPTMYYYNTADVCVVAG